MMVSHNAGNQRSVISLYPPEQSLIFEKEQTAPGIKT